MEGAAFERSLAEQARELLRKAQCAAEAASEPGVEKVLPFSRIIKQGGLVKELLPYNQFLLSVGRITGAVKGQRFLVWGAQHRADSEVPHKAEVVLVQVDDTSARGELVHQLDPTICIQAGDRLTLLGESAVRTLGGDGSGGRGELRRIAAVPRIFGHVRHQARILPALSAQSCPAAARGIRRGRPDARTGRTERRAGGGPGAPALRRGSACQPLQPAQRDAIPRRHGRGRTAAGLQGFLYGPEH